MASWVFWGFLATLFHCLERLDHLVVTHYANIAASHIRPLLFAEHWLAIENLIALFCSWKKKQKKIKGDIEKGLSCGIAV